MSKNCHSSATTFPAITTRSILVIFLLLIICISTSLTFQINYNDNHYYSNGILRRSLIDNNYQQQKQKSLIRITRNVILPYQKQQNNIFHPKSITTLAAQPQPQSKVPAPAPVNVKVKVIQQPQNTLPAVAPKNNNNLITTIAFIFGKASKKSRINKLLQMYLPASLKKKLFKRMIKQSLKKLQNDIHLLVKYIAASQSQASTGIIVNAAIGSILKAKGTETLTDNGLITATGLGILLWKTLGPKGWAFCVTYFMLGNFVTKLKMQYKEKLGIAEARNGKRGPENVFGSAGISALFATLAYLYPDRASLMKLGYVSALSTKLSDTFASEIGKAFGKSTYLITTMERVQPGTDGAISLEGTLAGILGSILLGFAGVGLNLIPRTQIPILTIAAFFANNIESLIGAAYQTDDGFLTNEMVNVINTSIGGILTLLLASPQKITKKGLF